jgi:tetratricopeptide (TPR) repeat protein/tRNA A-37 threonylcarbamoyl transferase component Bud32
MELRFVCSRGHVWQSQPLGAADEPRCPRCGTPGQTVGGPLAETLPAFEGTLPPDQLPPLVAPAPTIDAAPRPHSARAALPPHIGKYEILKRLGAGGMGVVYKARQTDLDRLVAIKMILDAQFAGEQSLGRFRQEAEAVARLQHPNIVQIFDVGEHEGRPFVALEYVGGSSLALRLEGRPQPPRAAARLMETLCRAVSHAHRRGIVHRDLKPGNILLASDELTGDEPAVAADAKPVPLDRLTPKIADFGLAKRLDRDSGHTQTDDVMGTPSYMAPEQAAGRTQDIGPAADLYSLGAILYELLTGRPPFVGENAMATLDQVLRQEPVPPSFLQPRVPRDLETICLKCLEKDPLRRYGSADELADDLSRFLEGRPIRARRASWLTRLAKWARRRPAAAGLIAVSAAALVVVLLGSQWYSAKLRWQRNQAEQSFKLAMIAMDGILDRIGENTLTYEPGAEQQRQFVLQRALPVYEQFLAHRGSDPRLRTEAARAYQRLGDVERWMGNYDKARRAYRSAVAILSSRIDGMPDAARRRRQAYCFNYTGEVERVAGTPEAAQEAYHQAIKIQEQLVAEVPGSPEYQQELARTSYNLAILYRETDRLAEAEGLFQEAIDRLQKLVERHDARADLRQELARAHLNLGPVLRSTGRATLAIESYGKAIELLQKLAAADARRPDYRYELAVAHTNRGNALLADGATTAAKEDYQFARRSLQELVGDYPHVPVFAEELANTENSLAALLVRTDGFSVAEMVWLEAAERLGQRAAQPNAASADHGRLAMTLGNLGWLYRRKQEPAKALVHLKEAIQSLDRALATNALHPDYRLTMRNAQRELSELLLERGDHAAASSAASELAKWSADAPPDLFRAACLLARAGLAAEEDAKLLPEERSRQSAQRYDQAARLLQELKAADLPDPKLVEQRKEQIAAALKRHAPLRKAFDRLEGTSPPSP